MRRYWDLITTNAAGVSIHASVKDATVWRADVPSIFKVSIHASVKDATYAYDVSYPD